MSSASPIRVDWLLQHQHFGNAQPGPQAAHVVQMRALVRSGRSAGGSCHALALPSAHLLPVSFGVVVAAVFDHCVWLIG